MTKLQRNRGGWEIREAEARFSRLHKDNWAEVVAYAVRRAPSAEDAAEVAAETFLVAWRRLEIVPPGPRTRLWLFGVARRLLSNQRRSEGRRTRLVERLRSELTAALQEDSTFDPDSPVMEILRRLNDKDREVLLLSSCEELEPAEIGEVLGISAAAARTRLYRARRRFVQKLPEKSTRQPEMLAELDPEEA